MPAPRDQVFISYSHKDKKWLERLQTMLKPLARTGVITPWDDTKIKPSAKWKTEIQNALASAKVAVLLVSDNFLASDFIDKHELPPLLEAARNDGLRVLWIPVKDCLYNETAIKDYQAVHDPAKPLNSLIGAQRDKALRSICEEIKEAAGPHQDITAPAGDLREANFAGQWEDVDGKPRPYEVTLRQEGIKVSGTYPEWGGTVAGEVKDDGKLHLTWCQTTNNRSGWAVLSLYLDGQRMEGPWGYDPGCGGDDLVRTWRFRRLPDKAPADVEPEARDSSAWLRMREELTSAVAKGYKQGWRTIKQLASKAGISEDAALDILREQPEVELGQIKLGRAARLTQR